MKKLLALLLTLVMVFALASCNLGETPSGSTPKGDEPPANTDGSTPKENEETTGDPNAAPTMEQLALEACLPGLTALEGCTFEKYRSFGVAFEKNGSLTADDMKTLVEAVWAICADVSPDGVYSVTNSGSTNTIKEAYASLTDKYGEEVKYVSREDDDGYIAFMQFEWYYTYEGKVRVVQINGNSNEIRAYTMDMGTLEK